MIRYLLHGRMIPQIYNGIAVCFGLSPHPEKSPGTRPTASLWRNTSAFQTGRWHHKKQIFPCQDNTDSHQDNTVDIFRKMSRIPPTFDFDEYVNSIILVTV